MRSRHPLPRTFHRTALALAVMFWCSREADAQTYPSAVIPSGSNLNYEQSFDGDIVPVGLIQGSVTIHPVPPYPSQLGGAGVSVFDGAHVTIDPNQGTPGPVTIISDYRSGAPNDALYIAYGTVDIIASTHGVDLIGNGQTVHGLYMPEAVRGPSLLNAANVRIQTNGATADGVRMYGARSTVAFTDTSVTTSGPSSWGLLSWGGSNATFNNTTISAQGTGGGVWAYNGSSATLDGNSAVSTAVDGNYGVLAQSLGTVGTNTDAAATGRVSIRTSGASSHAFRVSTATGRPNRVDISTAGASSHGLYANGTSTVTGSDVSVTTTGASSYGIWIANNTTATLNGGTITTRGTNAYGMLAGTSSGVSTVNLSGFDIATHGQAAYGLYGWTASTTNFSGGSIATDQANTPAVYARAGTVNLLRDAGGAGSAITTTGSAAHAVRVLDAGSFSAIGANVHARGSGAVGISFEAPATFTSTPTGVGATPLPPLPPTTPLLDPSAPPPPPAVALEDSPAPSDVPEVPASPAGSAPVSAAGTGGLSPAAAFSPAASSNSMTLQDTTVVSDTSAALWLNGGFADVDLSGSSLIGNPWAIYVSARTVGGAPLAATAQVDADDSVLQGRIQTIAGSTATLNLSNGSLWSVTASSNLTNLSNDASLIDFPTTAALVANPLDAAAYRTITVEGSYVGNGGTLALNTHLAGDDSPSDRLVIANGSGDGSTFVQIKNTDGEGDITDADGILVVQALGSTTTTGAFTLAAPAVAGPYEYFLYRGGATVASADTDNSWYLRSEIDCSLPGAPSPPCPAPPPPDPDPDPDPGPGPDPEPDPPEPPTPAYRQEVSLIAALPAMASIYGRTIIDTLHERVGDEELLRDREDLDPTHSGVNGAWIRYIAHDGERDDGNLGIYGTRGPGFDYRFDALQIGQDLYRHTDADNGTRQHAGFYLAYGKAKGEIRHNYLDYEFHAGRDRFTAMTLGGYWTAFNGQGAYLDAVAQYTSYDLRAESTRFPDDTTDADGSTLSLEGSWPFALTQAGSARARWRLSPQAQVIWQKVDVDSIEDDQLHVRFADGDSLVARVGAQLDRAGIRRNRNGDSRSSSAWLRANAWREFRGEYEARFETETRFLPFPGDLGGSWGEVGLGGTWQVTRNGYAFADVDYSWSFDGDDSAWNGKLGLRWNW